MTQDVQSLIIGIAAFLAMTLASVAINSFFKSHNKTKEALDEEFKKDIAKLLIDVAKINQNLVVYTERTAHLQNLVASNIDSIKELQRELTNLYKKLPK